MHLCKAMILCALVTLVVACGPKKATLDCSQWHIGSYELVDQSRNILIERTATEQVETDRNTGSYNKFLVEWLDDCTYRLYFKEGEERFLEVWKDNYLEVVILKGTEDGYAYQARSSQSDKIENYEIKKIK